MYVLVTDALSIQDVHIIVNQNIKAVRLVQVVWIAKFWPKKHMSIAQKLLNDVIDGWRRNQNSNNPKSSR